jgi:OmpA family
VLVLLAPSLAALVALAAPPACPAWVDRLHPGARFSVEGIAFDGRGGTLAHGDGLSELAAALREAPWVHVRLEGFVDSSGDPEGDVRLSATMAREAAERLVALGVGPARVSWSGRGGDSPLLPNFTARARAANRRVEVVIVPRAGSGT